MVSLSIPVQERKKGAELKSFQVVVAIDPGVKNAGMAYFTRDGVTKQIKLEVASQCDLTNLPEEELALFFFNSAVKLTVDCNTMYMRQLPTPKSLINKIAFIIEQPYGLNPHAHKLLATLKAHIKSIEPYAPDYTFGVFVISPKTVAKHLGLPPSKNWSQRKNATQEVVEKKLGVLFPRHDSADAVAIGVAAILQKKVILEPLMFPLNALDRFFIDMGDLEAQTPSPNLPEVIGEAEPSRTFPPLFPTRSSEDPLGEIEEIPFETEEIPITPPLKDDTEEADPGFIPHRYKLLQAKAELAKDELDDD